MYIKGSINSYTNDDYKASYLNEMAIGNIIAALNCNAIVSRLSHDELERLVNVVNYHIAITAKDVEKNMTPKEITKDDNNCYLGSIFNMK